MKLESFDLVETRDGLIFVVYGIKHKREFIRGFLRFYPSKCGDYIYGGRKYEKMSSFSPRNLELKKLIKKYKTDLFGGPNVYWVPRKDILKTHHSKDNLRLLLKGNNPHKRYLKQFLLIFGFNLENLGLTGSMGVGMHKRGEYDFDFVIRSKEERRQLLRSISNRKTLLKMKSLGIRSVEKEECLKNAKKLSKLYKIPVKSAYEVMMKDHLKFFSMRDFYTGFVMNPLTEDKFNLPKESLTKKRTILEGIIVGDSGRFANPRRYLIKADYSKEWRGKSFWVFTYLHLFKNVGSNGDRVKICGTVSSRGNVYLVRQGDYILPI